MTFTVKRVDKISLKKNVSGSIGNKDSLGINLFQQVFTCQLLQRQSKKKWIVKEHIDDWLRS